LNIYFRRKNSKSKEGVEASYIIFYNLDLSEDVNGVSCKVIHSNVLLKIIITIKFSFNLTPTVDRKTGIDES
jgi:hypothetical protein